MYYLATPITCEWSLWEAGDCSNSCGKGTRTKTRIKIMNNEMSGSKCEGRNIMVEPCVKETCPGNLFTKNIRFQDVIMFLCSAYINKPLTHYSFTYSVLQGKRRDSVRSVTTPEGKCTVGGNRKCNHATWDEFGGYRDGCCTPDQKCGVNEGDCSDDSDCYPGLVCGTKNCPKGVGFDDRADCCEPISGIFKPSKHI